MTDTHCHLSFSQYDADRAEVLSRAAAAGVKIIVNPGTDLAQSRAAVALAQSTSGVSPSTPEVFAAVAQSTSGVSPSTPEVFAAVGVHPQDVATLTPDAFDAIREFAHHPRVVAVGEVGLELSSRAARLALQEEWLEHCADLAEEVGKPLVFHIRNAHAEFRRFLERRGTRVRGVVHCFSGTPDDARFYISQGLRLGLTGIVTFPNAEGLREVVQTVPLEHLLLETDAPFLAPQSQRGKRNEPAYLKDVAEKVAAVKGVSVAEVERVTDENATRLFGLKGARFGPSGLAMTRVRLH